MEFIGFDCSGEVFLILFSTGETIFLIGDDGGRRRHSDGGKETKISIEIGMSKEETVLRDEEREIGHWKQISQ